METHLFINPHTQGVEEVQCQKCKVCRKVLPEWKYYPTIRDQIMEKCKTCYDQYYMAKNDADTLLPMEYHVKRAVQRANRRSRYRLSEGKELKMQEALRLWTGECAHCHTELHFRWFPRTTNDNFAIIDRVDTSSNASYSGNMQWLCNACNTEKGAWDLMAMKDEEIRRLKKKIKGRKRKFDRVRSYESILYPAHS